MRNFLLYSLSPLEFCFLHVWGPAKPVSSLSSLKFRLFSQVLHWNISSWRQLLRLLISTTVCLSVGWFPLCYHQVMLAGQSSLYLKSLLSFPGHWQPRLNLTVPACWRDQQCGHIFRAGTGCWDFVKSHEACQEQSSDQNLSLRQCTVFLRLY